MSLMKFTILQFYILLQNARVAAFTVSELPFSSYSFYRFTLSRLVGKRGVTFLREEGGGGGCNTNIERALPEQGEGGLDIKSEKLMTK